MRTSKINNNIAREDAHYILDSIKPDLDRLKNKRILITGATGFIGSNLLEFFALYNELYGETSCAVLGLARNPQKLERIAPHLFGRQDIVILAGDVRSFKFPRPFDYVIHAAAPVDPVALRYYPLEAADIIVNGTLQVLQQSIEHKVSRVLYISSGAVYGRQPVDLSGLPEYYLGGPDTTDINSSYGEAKRYAETLCSIFRKTHGLSIAIARPFSFIGPYQDIEAGFAATQFIYSALKGESIQIKSDGTALRSYCYSADLVVALWKIFFEGKEDGVYNVGSAEPISIVDLAWAIVNVVNPRLDVVVLQKTKSEGKPSRYIPDITRLQSELRVNFRFKFSDALERAINWQKTANSFLER